MILRSLPGLLKTKLLKKRVPFKVTQEVTNQCNLNCSYCPIDKSKTAELSLEKSKQLMADFKRLGTIGWSFTGGEPLLRQDLKQLIDHAKSLNFHTMLTTNALLLKERYDDLKNLDGIVVSLDAPNNELNSLTKKHDCFDRILSNIKFISDKKPTIINTVLTEYNINHIRDMILLAKDLGVKIIFHPKYSNFDNNGPLYKNFVDNDAYQNAIKLIMKYKKLGYPIASSFDFYAQNLKYPDSNNVKCYAGVNFVYITTDGFLRSCQFDPNGIDLNTTPTKQALGKLSFKDCRGCYLNCYLEYNLTFSLKPKTILNNLKNFINP